MLDEPSLDEPSLDAPPPIPAHYAQRDRADRHRTNTVLVWLSVAVHLVLSLAMAGLGHDPGWISFGTILAAQLGVAFWLTRSGGARLTAALLMLAMMMEARIIQLGLFVPDLPPMMVASATVLLGFGLTVVELPDRWPSVALIGVHGLPIVADFWWPDLLPTVGTVFLATAMICALSISFLFSSRRAQLALLTHRLEQESDVDRLTGTASRARFLDRVSRRLRRSRHDRAPGSLLFLEVAATAGGPDPDTILAVVGSTLRETLRPTDLVGRMGPRAFGVFLSGDQPHAAVDRLRGHLDRVTGGRVRFWMGLAHTTHGETDLIALLAGAETALGEARVTRTPLISRTLTPI